MKIDNKSFAIGFLSASAVMLLAINLLLPEPATAAVTIKERDYTAVTGRITKGGEALYLTDNRTGTLAVIAYDPGKRALTPLAVRPVSDAFTSRAPRDDRNERPGRNQPNNRVDR